jgi:ribosomal protein S18 acetylase RimI-like enzyme
MRKLYELSSIHSEIGYRKGPWEEDFDDMENHYAGGEFFVGYIGETWVAMGGYRRISDSQGQVRRMRVHPDYRRKGYAQEILAKIEESARENNLSGLKLKTSTQQIMAQNFYEKNGFTRIKMDKKEYYEEGEGNSFEVIWYLKKL